MTTDSYQLSPQARKRWKERIEAEQRRCNKTYSFIAITIEEKSTGKGTSSLKLAPELSRFTQGDEATLRRWFTLHRKTYVEHLEQLLELDTGTLARWLTEVQREDPHAETLPWHPSFPEIPAGEISISIAAQREDKPGLVTPEAFAQELTRSITPDPAKEKPDPPSPLEGWIHVRGPRGAGCRTYAERLAQILNASVQTSSNSVVAPALPTSGTKGDRSTGATPPPSFRVELASDHEDIQALKMQHPRGIILVTYDADLETIGVNVGPGLEPYIAFPARTDLVPKEPTVRIGEWNTGEAHAAISELCCHSRVSSSQREALRRFDAELTKQPALLGFDRWADRVLSLLGEVASGRAPHSPTEIRIRQSRATWRAAAKRDNSNVLELYGEALVVRLWGQWLLGSTTTRRYEGLSHQLDWRFIPDTDVRTFLLEAAGDFPASADPDKSLRAAFDNYEQAPGKHKQTLLEALKRKVLAPRGEALLYALERGGLLRRADRDVQVGGKAEAGWVPVHPALATLWAARYLLESPFLTLAHGWERLLDRRWHDLLRELAVAGMRPERFLELLKDAPDWALIDRARWVVLFAASSPGLWPVPLVNDALIPAWATTIWAILHGMYSPWLENLGVQFADEAQALVSISEKYQDVLPDLTSISFTWWESTFPESDSVAPLVEEMLECIPSASQCGLFVPGMAEEPESPRDSLHRLEALVPHLLRARVQRWRKTPPRQAPNKAELPEGFKFSGSLLKNHQTGWQDWQKRAQLENVLACLAPHQVLPLKLDDLSKLPYTTDSEGFFLPRVAPSPDTCAEVWRRIDAAAERGYLAAQYVLAGLVITTDPNRRRAWHGAWVQIPLEIRCKWMQKVRPTPREIWMRVVSRSRGVEAQLLGNEIPPHAAWSSQDEFWLKQKLAGLPENLIQAFQELDTQDERFVKARAPAIFESPGSGVQEASASVYSPEQIERLVHFYSSLDRKSVNTWLRQRPKLFREDTYPGAIGVSLLSTHFCIRLAEATCDHEWLEYLIQTLWKRTEPEQASLFLGDEPFGGLSVNVYHGSGHRSWRIPRLLDDAGELRLLRLQLSADAWSEDAALALLRLGKPEAMRARWTRIAPAELTPALQGILRQIYALRFIIRNPAPISEHMLRILQQIMDWKDEFDHWREHRSSQKLDRAQHIDNVKALAAVLDDKLHHFSALKRQASQYSTLLSPGSPNQLEDVQASLTALAQQLLASHGELLRSLGWSSAGKERMFGCGHTASNSEMDALWLRNSLLEVAPTFHHPLYEGVVKRTRERSLYLPSDSTLKTPRLLAVVRENNLPQLKLELEEVLRVLASVGTSEELTLELRQWLAQLHYALLPGGWARRGMVREAHKHQRARAFQALLDARDEAPINVWLEALEEVQDTPIRVHSLKSHFERLPSDQNMINEIHTHLLEAPSMLDLIWSRTDLSQKQRDALLELGLGEWSREKLELPRPWAIQHVAASSETSVLRRYAERVKGSPRGCPLLERLLERLPPGREHAYWALQLHQHKPWNAHLLAALKFWGLEDPEPLSGGSEWSWWPEAIARGEFPYEEREEDGRQVRRLIAKYRHLENSPYAPSAGGVMELSKCLLAWSKHLQDNASASAVHKEWMETATKRLLELMLDSPIKGNPTPIELYRAEDWKFHLMATRHLAGLELPLYSLFLTAINLGQEPWLMELYHHPPQTQPGDEAELKQFPEQWPGEVPLTRGTLLRHWLRDLLKLKKDDAFNQGRAALDVWKDRQSLLNRAEPLDEVLYNVLELMRLYLGDREPLPRLEAWLLDWDPLDLAAPKTALIALGLEEYTSSAYDNGLSILCLDLHWSDPPVRLWLQQMDFLWRLNPPLASQLEARLIARHPAQLKVRQGRLSNLQLFERFWSPLVARLAREQLLTEE